MHIKDQPHRRKFFPLLLLLFSSISLLQAQDRVLFSGVVRVGQTGDLLAGASVLSQKDKVSTSTDSRGQWQLNLSSGAQTLITSYLGFRSDTLVITENQKRHPIIIYLYLDTLSLPETHIVGQADTWKLSRMAPGQIRVSSTEMQKVPSLMGEQDPLGALRSLPGIQSVGEGSGYFYVRGGNADQNLILLDEATLYNPSHLLGIFSVINPGIISSMSVYKGGIPANYGDRLASVMDLSTRSGDMHKVSGEVSAGLIASRILVQGPLLRDRLSYLFAIRRTHLDLYTPLIFNKNSPFHGSGYSFLDINGKLSWRFSDNRLLTLSAYTGTDRFRLNDAEVQLEDHMSWGNQSVSFISEHRISSAIQGKTVAAWSGYRMDFTQYYRDFTMGLQSGLSNFKIRQEFRIHFNEKHSILTGIEFQSYRFKPYRMPVYGGIDDMLMGDSLPYVAREAAVFIHHEWKPMPSWSVQTGLRLMGYGHFGPFDRYIYDNNSFPIDTLHYKHGERLAAYFRAEPRIACSWQLAPEHTIKASATRQYQPVSMVPVATATLPLDLWIPSTALMPPQSATSLSLGWFFDPNRDGIEAYVDGFFRWMDHQVEFSENLTLLGLVKDNIDRQVTQGTGTAHGIEFFIRKKTGRTQGWIGYTWSQVWLTFPEINNGKRFHPRYDRTHDFNLMITHTFGSRWEGSFQFIYATGQSTTIPLAIYVYNGSIVQQFSERNAYRLPAYHRIDLALTRKPAKEKKMQSSWTFSVYNLYNRLNPMFIYYDLYWDYQTSLLYTRSRKVALLPVLPSVTWTLRF